LINGVSVGSDDVHFLTADASKLYRPAKQLAFVVLNNQLQRHLDA